MILTTWVAMAVVLTSENRMEKPGLSWMKSFWDNYRAFQHVLVLVYWLWHAGSLASIAANTASDVQWGFKTGESLRWLLGKYYLYMFVLVLLTGLTLSVDRQTSDAVRLHIRGLVTQSSF